METSKNAKNTITNFLHIKNTSDRILNVNVTKKPLPERCVDLSFTNTVIEAKNSAILKITWSPKEEDCWHDTLELTDDHQNKYIIPLVFSTKYSQKTSYKAKATKDRVGQILHKSNTFSDENVKMASSQSSYPPGKFLDHHQKSSLDKNLQSRHKRTRMDCYLEDFDKENKTDNAELFSETIIVKRKRKETFNSSISSTTFTLIPVKFNLDTRQNMPETRILDFNFPAQNPSLLFMEKDSEIKNLRKETSSKCQENLIKIDENQNEYKSEFNDFLSFSKGKARSDFSLLIDTVNSTPQIIEAPEKTTNETCTRTPFSSTTFLKSTRIQNFELLPPAIPALKNKTEFTSSSLLSLNSSILKTPNRIVNSTAKEVLEADVLIKDKNTFPLRVAEKIPEEQEEKLEEEMKKKIEEEKKDFKSLVLEISPTKLRGTPQKTGKIKKISLINGKNEYFFLNGQNWIPLEELEFKKWLNALMTPPEDFSTEATSVDIGSIWQSCRTKEDVLPESKESISARYHTDTRLNTLRKAACKIFRNDEVKKALLGAMKCIENKKLEIKVDRNLHRDIGLQKEILELFLSYNPLWLRIGLETVYGETIPLKSNNDLIGLTRFLLVRFFSDQSVIKEHSHPKVVGMRLPTFISTMNDFMLKKFLQIVYFLDYAKVNKLIGDDPCLFRKKASHKESRSILVTFSSKVLGGIGDITKVLRISGYEVKHKQSYLEEFDYAVQDMSSDLRDGVRLCRAMELITGKRDLICKCSVPVNSKVQRIHNINIALKTLLDLGYVLTGEIDAKSIAEGHREKTLSLLWQIIYKFQAPRFEKAANCLQTWWRSKLWYVRLKNLLKKRRNDAACIVQRSWRHYSAKKFNRLEKHQKDLQVRNTFIEIKSVLRIQRWWRGIRDTKPFVESLRNTLKFVILVQKVWKAKKLMQKQRSEFLQLREASSKIQVLWRAKLVGKSKRLEYENLKKAAVFLQRRWRTLKLKRILTASQVIQKWWKRVLLLRKDRNNFLLMKNAVRIFEKTWIEKNTISEERKEFLQKRQSAIVIQRFWRSKKEILRFRVCRRSVLRIQSWWRSLLVRREYKIKKKSSLLLQKWWRSLQETKTCKAQYQRTKISVLVIQRNWKMIKTRRHYLEMKSASVKIQSWFRMTEQRKKFEILLKKHKAAIVIQRRWRSILTERKAAVKIQNWWKTIFIMRKCRNDYLQMKNSVIKLQRKYRAKVLGKEITRKYEDLRKAILKIQACWRMVLVKREVKLLIRRKKAVIIIENWLREVLKRKQIEEEKAEEMRRIEKAVVKIQAVYRGYKVREAESSRMSELRKRTEKIARLAIPAKTLAIRLKESINVFSVSNDLGRLSMCLASLDLITRLSDKSCSIVCDVGLVNKIYGTLERSNRSLPWMDTCLRATSILLNLAKYPRTKSFVLKEKYIETLARFLTVTVEKEVELFLHLATLMWILIENPDYAKAVLKDSRSVWLLNSLKDKVTRKKEKFAQISSKEKKEKMPNPKPDWGLKQKQPRLFGNVFHAVNSIMKRLSEYQEKPID